MLKYHFRRQIIKSTIKINKGVIYGCNFRDMVVILLRNQRFRWFSESQDLTEFKRNKSPRLSNIII